MRHSRTKVSQTSFTGTRLDREKLYDIQLHRHQNFQILQLSPHFKSLKKVHKFEVNTRPWGWILHVASTWRKLVTLGPEYLGYWGRKFVKKKSFLIFLKSPRHLLDIRDIEVQLYILHVVSNINDKILTFRTIHVEYFYNFQSLCIIFYSTIVNPVYFVVDLLQDEIWLGMQSNVWFDASPRDFSNWRDPKFSDYPCIVMDTNQQWHADHCTRTHLYVCKISA